MELKVEADRSGGGSTREYPADDRAAASAVRSAEEQHVLEAASVAGVEFSAAAVAAALEEEVTQVEERCERLVRREQFLRSLGIGEWPDGTVAGRYGFRHVLYQNILYQRMVEHGVCTSIDGSASVQRLRVAVR